MTQPAIERSKQVECPFCKAHLSVADGRIIAATQAGEVGEWVDGAVKATIPFKDVKED